MKHYAKEFVKRGLMAAAGGPVILAIIYAIEGATGGMTRVPVGEVSMGILTITLMAFIAAGITVVYQMEALPLLSAILLHGVVLYLDYLLIYLLNSWLPRNWMALGIFTAFFVGGYGLIHLCIYFSVKRKTQRINLKLQS